VANDVTEIQQAKAWLYTILHANTYIASQVGTRIYDSYVPKPPANRTYPYVLFNFMGGTDVDGLGTNRLQSHPLFQVRVVDEGRPTTVTRRLDKEIDIALQNAVYQPSGDYYFSARREQPIDRSELDASTGKYYANIGGLYRLYIGRST
jgi:hypothetical protein